MSRWFCLGLGSFTIPQLMCPSALSIGHSPSVTWVWCGFCLAGRPLKISLQVPSDLILCRERRERLTNNDQAPMPTASRPLSTYSSSWPRLSGDCLCPVDTVCANPRSEASCLSLPATLCRLLPFIVPPGGCGEQWVAHICSSCCWLIVGGWFSHLFPSKWTSGSRCGWVELICWSDASNQLQLRMEAGSSFTWTR